MNVPSNQCQPVAVITGGSRGIGAATAKLFAQKGYKVAVNFRRDTAKAHEVVQAIATDGGEAIAIQGDVSREQDVANLFQQVHQVWGVPAVLVNNAGILKPHASVIEMDADRINQTLATNVTGAFLCCKYAVKAMSTAYGGAGGAIVNVSSAASRLGAPNEYVDYAASKAAVDTLTIGLAQEVGEQGVRVNAVRPGVIYTDIHASGGEPARVDRVKHRVPMRRGGQPQEVAEAIYWLASNKSSYSTGAILDVSGGR